MGDSAAMNRAEEIIIWVRKLVIAEAKHAARIEISTRDDADDACTALAMFTVADCDAALRVVKRRRAAQRASNEGREDG